MRKRKHDPTRNQQGTHVPTGRVTHHHARKSKRPSKKLSYLNADTWGTPHRVWTSRVSVTFNHFKHGISQQHSNQLQLNQKHLSLGDSGVRESNFPHCLLWMKRRPAGLRHPPPFFKKGETCSLKVQPRRYSAGHRILKVINEISRSQNNSHLHLKLLQWNHMTPSSECFMWHLLEVAFALAMCGFLSLL